MELHKELSWIDNIQKNHFVCLGQFFYVIQTEQLTPTRFLR